MEDKWIFKVESKDNEFRFETTESELRIQIFQLQIKNTMQTTNDM